MMKIVSKIIFEIFLSDLIFFPQVILALYFIKLTTSYNIYNRNNEFINNNLNPLNIYSYVSDDDHSNYIFQNVNNVPQINDIRIVKMDSRDEDNLRHFRYFFFNFY